MIIKPHQIFIIDKYLRENETLNRIISDKFNKTFRSNTKTYLRSSYENLAPYKFIRDKDSNNNLFRCIKVIHSNQHKIVTRVRVFAHHKDTPLTFEIMFINMARICKANIDSYRDVLKLKREYEIKTAK